MRGLRRMVLVTAVLGAAAAVDAGVVVSTSSTAATFSGSPVIDTTAGASYNNGSTTLTGVDAFYVAQGPVADGVAVQTFIPAAGFQLDKVTIKVSGAGGGTTGTLSVGLYSIAYGGTESQSYMGLGTELLNSGTDFSFSLNASANDRFLTFDFNGSDEIQLAAGTRYAFVIKNTTGVDIGWYRTAYSPYTSGNMYVGTPSTNTTPNAVNGVSRDAAFAVYAVPEPTSLAFLGALSLLCLRRRHG